MTQELATNLFTGTGPAFLGAGIAMILGGIGSIIGISIVGSMGAGVSSEKPDTFSKVLILSALPGSQGIYGFVGAFLIMVKINLFGEMLELTSQMGWLIFFAALPVAFTGLFSGIYQGKVAASGLNIIAKDASKVGQALTLAVLVETYAILGLLITIFLLMMGINI